MSPIISVSNLSKAYRIGKKADRADSFVGMLQDSIAAPFINWRRMAQVGSGCNTSQDDLHWALRSVSIDVNRAEVVGIIGKNGAGKSTLLKILSRITEPTDGEVRIRGRVASLLEVGTGFHPDLSGRENVYLNGTILGMRKSEIDRKFEEIVEFSGVGKFLDTPIKRYSSGMKVRLAFAVAAFLEPEILIVDEVLAVGDAEFQKKCLGKMKDIATDSGRTVLFVSHNMNAVMTLCTKAVHLEQGKALLVSDVNTVIEHYLSAGDTKVVSSWTRRKIGTHNGRLFVDCVEVELLGEQPYHKLRLKVRTLSQEEHPPAFIAIDIHTIDGGWLMQAIPRLDAFVRQNDLSREILIEVDLPPLVPGVYPVSIWLGSSFFDTLDWVREVVQFEVANSPSPGRTAPHVRERGFCVPVSRVVTD
jgi:lipopolysaccharide transport system ATP-binding protein